MTLSPEERQRLLDEVGDVVRNEVLPALGEPAKRYGHFEDYTFGDDPKAPEGTSGNINLYKPEGSEGRIKQLTSGVVQYDSKPGYQRVVGGEDTNVHFGPDERVTAINYNYDGNSDSRNTTLFNREGAEKVKSALRRAAGLRRTSPRPSAI